MEVGPRFAAQCRVHEKRSAPLFPHSALFPLLGLMAVLASGCHGHESTNTATAVSDTSVTTSSSASQSATTDTSGTYGGARTPVAPPTNGAPPGAIGTSGGQPPPPPKPALSTTGTAGTTTPAPAGTPPINDKSVVKKP
jgi:hypothetical protein